MLLVFVLSICHKNIDWPSRTFQTYGTVIMHDTMIYILSHLTRKFSYLAVNIIHPFIRCVSCCIYIFSYRIFHIYTNRLFIVVYLWMQYIVKGAITLLPNYALFLNITSYQLPKNVIHSKGINIVLWFHVTINVWWRNINASIDVSLYLNKSDGPMYLQECCEHQK